LSVPRADWPPAVDARPPAQPKESFISISSESGGVDIDQVESAPSASEKVQGKRPAADEPAQKKRKTATATPIKPGSISLGGDQTTRTRRTVVIEWSDDDEALVFPLLSTREPPRSTRAWDQSKVGEEVPESEMREVPKQQAEVNPEQQTKKALER